MQRPPADCDMCGRPLQHPMRSSWEYQARATHPPSLLKARPASLGRPGAPRGEAGCVVPPESGSALGSLRGQAEARVASLQWGRAAERSLAPQPHNDPLVLNPSLPAQADMAEAIQFGITSAQLCSQCYREQRTAAEGRPAASAPSRGPPTPPALATAVVTLGCRQVPLAGFVEVRPVLDPPAARAAAADHARPHAGSDSAAPATVGRSAGGLGAAELGAVRWMQDVAALRVCSLQPAHPREPRRGRRPSDWRLGGRAAVGCPAALDVPRLPGGGGRRRRHR
eukprot:scaffold1009_cov90-Isochrysis_galbana.AAC.1